MDAEIVSLAGACEKCTSRLPSLPPEPLQSHKPASRPFEQIHAHLCEINGRHFLIQVDSFSGWPHVVFLPDAHITSKKVINAAQELFINVVVHIKYWSDGGTQFPSVEFKQFLEEWGVSLAVSSPHFHQSNEVAEAGVKSMKKMIAGSFTSNSFDINKIWTVAPSVPQHCHFRWPITGSDCLQSPHARLPSSPSPFVRSQVEERCRHPRKTGKTC